MNNRSFLPRRSGPRSPVPREDIQGPGVAGRGVVITVVSRYQGRVAGRVVLRAGLAFSSRAKTFAVFPPRRKRLTIT